MQIYPIAESLERLMESFIDPDTGELTATEEEMQAAIEQMQMDFDEKIIELRNEYINLTAEAEAIKNERAKLEIRQKRAEDAADRLKRWLAYLLKGEKFNLGACKISYRKSEEVVFEKDENGKEKTEQFVLWADKNFPSLLSYQKPKPNKTEIKKALDAGQKVDFAKIQSRQNIQVK